MAKSLNNINCEQINHIKWERSSKSTFLLNFGSFQLLFLLSLFIIFRFLYLYALHFVRNGPNTIALALRPEIDWKSLNSVHTIESWYFFFTFAPLKLIVHYFCSIFFLSLNNSYESEKNNNHYFRLQSKIDAVYRLNFSTHSHSHESVYEKKCSSWNDCDKIYTVQNLFPFLSLQWYYWLKIVYRMSYEPKSSHFYFYC
jgi:hypothetical protein